MSTDIEQKIRVFIENNFLYWEGSELLKDTDSFLSHGIIDSAGVLELITYLETEFAITITDPEVLPSNLDSIEAASEFVRRKLQPSLPSLPSEGTTLCASNSY